LGPLLGIMNTHMRFVSKCSNLRLILRPGIPANLIGGTLGDPGLSVKFKDGTLDVYDEEVITKLKRHPGFNSDFICVDDSGTDPFASYREEQEPNHVITEIKYGHVERTTGSPRKVKIPPELQNVINQQAMEMAKKMLPDMIKETLEKFSEMKAERAVKEPSHEEFEASVEETEPSADEGFEIETDEEGLPEPKAAPAGVLASIAGQNIPAAPKKRGRPAKSAL